MRLVFLGAPGAGKGTVAELLHERLKVVHLSSGDLLREAVRRRSLIGQQAARCMQEGALVPDALVTDLMLQHLNDLGEEQSFTLDGFPRTGEQAQALDQALAQRCQAPIDLAVDFEVSSETVVSRLAGRRVCGSCGANYHLVTLPPRVAGRCDRCGSELQTRADDRPETILKRLQVYQEQTAPLLAFYRAQGKLRTTTGETGIEQQYQVLLELLRRERLVG